MARENDFADAGQRLALPDAPAAPTPKGHGTKLMREIALALILALVAAVVVELVRPSLFAPPDRPNGCDAAFSDAGLARTMFRCGDAGLARPDIRI